MSAQRSARIAARVRPRGSLAGQLFVLQVIVVAVVVLGGTALVYYDAWRQSSSAARDQVVAVAKTLAATPNVRDGLASPDPTSTLQPLAEQVRLDAGIDFVTIMSPSGIRYTHPDPARIGKPFLGHIDQAVAGHVLTETYTGTLGPSVRAVVPVYRDDRLVGLVADGITIRVLSNDLRQRVGVLFAVATGALLLGGLLTYLVSNRVRRHTHGMRPDELSRMYEYHDAILHAVHEGLLLVGPDRRLSLCNDGAAVLLEWDAAEVEGELVSELALPPSLRETLEAGREVRDEVHLTDRHVLLVSVAEVRSGGRDQGSVVTLRDHTELQALSGELDSMRGFAEALRSQAHESANRLHTVVSLIELGRAEEAVSFATAELDLAQRLTDRVVGAVGEPVVAALLLGKIAEAAERGVEVVLSEDSEIDDAAVAHLESRDLVTILGNLIDNAVEAVAEQPAPHVEVTLRSTVDGLVLRVADNGPGVDPDDARRLFQRGWSTKSDQRGLGLALVGQSVRRHGGGIDVRSEGGAVFTVSLPGGAR